MNSYRKILMGVVGLFSLLTVQTSAQRRQPTYAPTGQGVQMTSPEGRLSVVMCPNGFEVLHDGHHALQVEGMPGLRLVGKPSHVKTDYQMVTGKRLHCTNEANEYTLAMGRDTLVRLRLYHDGVAFRYEYSRLKKAKIAKETTAYRIEGAKNYWLQKYDASYENFYVDRNHIDKALRHFAFPALIENGNNQVLLTEANIERRQSAASLWKEGNGTLRVEADRNDLTISGSWHSPWRVAIIGTWADIVESTLVTDVSDPCRLKDVSWIKPGMASWVYWAHNHGSSDYQILKQYVDMAANMRLPYTLIDAEWDGMKNGGTIEDIIRYAQEHGVKPIIWYNSETGWLAKDGSPGPHGRLNRAEDREHEFAWLEKMGVAGVKIDFFAGDTQATMDYCLDLLESAARYHLVVNFHGATLPRGWQRTYPNLVSTEGVYGEEWYNNGPVMTTHAPEHNCMLPFTRNVVGSMDYTPCAFTNSQYPHITSSAHELALTVAYESGIQHLADRPESFAAQSEAVRSFISTLPTAWDDTRLIGGNPGEWVAIARKKGNDWYVAVLNGTDHTLHVSPDFRLIDHGTYQVESFGEGDEQLSQHTLDAVKTMLSGSSLDRPQEASLRLKAWGGAVLRLKLQNE